ncbi:MAG: LysM peptidoglycan-binding domain-containing protein [Chloroflexota bacterium]
METICPLLTLGGDPRAVSATADPAHRCAASGSLSAIDRDHQVRFCLGGGYEGCSRYRTHVEVVGPVGPTWGPAAPDATFGSTRVVLEAAPRAIIPTRSRRVGTAALVVILLIGIGAAVSWLGLRGLQGLVSPPDVSPSPSVAVSPSPSPEPSGTASPPASPTATPEPTPTPAPTPIPAPTPVTYIVQSGDTLNAIAARFGTTAQAIRDANGISGDIIHPGQVLIIPVP